MRSPGSVTCCKRAPTARLRALNSDLEGRVAAVAHDLDSPMSSIDAGARRVLARLGGAHPLGLVTSGDRDRVTRQLREFGLTTLFAARVCSGDTLRKKPHPEPLRLALRQMKLDPSACVYVGDAPQDVEMAQRAGVRAIGVLGPFPTEKRLRAARPEFLIRSIEELPDLLKKLLR